MKKLLTFLILMVVFIWSVFSYAECLRPELLNWWDTTVSWVHPDTGEKKAIITSALYYGGGGPWCLYYPCPKGLDHLDVTMIIPNNPQPFTFRAETKQEAIDMCIQHIRDLLGECKHEI